MMCYVSLKFIFSGADDAVENACAIYEEVFGDSFPEKNSRGQTVICVDADCAVDPDTYISLLQDFANELSAAELDVSFTVTGQIECGEAFDIDARYANGQFECKDSFF